MSYSARIVTAKKSICFIYIKTPAEGLKVIGTGFFLGEPIADNRYRIYLVTAKHVLMPPGSPPRKEVYLRLNRRDGAASFERVALENQFKILTHDDQDVDIAVVRVTPDDTKFDYAWLDSELIPKASHLSERHVAEGTLVFMVGLFSPYIGTKKDQPFLRYGRVALMPEEKIPINEEGQSLKQIEAYLCECLSFSGNSGSPMFFAFERVDNLGRVRYDEPDLFLAGVVKGHYPDMLKKGLVKDERDVYYQLNGGITVVTPSFQLRELLDITELAQERETLKQAFSASKSGNSSDPLL